MDAERENDQHALIHILCNTSPSQEAKFTNCRFASESQDSGDSTPEQSSPSEAPAIFMISPPECSSPVYVEEDAVFLTPPEHHSHSHLSSSEDQNPNDLRAEADRTTKRVRTEVVEIEGDENVDDTVVMALDGGDSDCEEIEGFGDRKCEGRPVGTGRRRRLPPSLKGKEKQKEKEKEKGKEKEKEKKKEKSLEKKSSLQGLLDVLGVVFGDSDSGSEDVDFLETAKRRGITFPKPRWWPSDKEWMAMTKSCVSPQLTYNYSTNKSAE